MSYIKNHNKDIPKTETETKTIYQKRIQEGSKQHIIVGETQWKKHLRTTDFRQILEKTFESYAQPFFNNLHYRLMLTQQQSKLWPLWTHIRRLTFIYKMLKNTKNLDTPPTNTNKTNRKNLYLATTLTLLNLKNKSTRKLTITIIQIILFEIWQSRNNNKYDKNLPQNNNKQNKRTTTTHFTSTIQKTWTKQHITSIQRSILRKWIHS